VSSATTVTISSPELLSLQLSKQTLELALGETDSIQVQGTYKGDVVVDVTDDVQWTSANDAIATVSSSGSVKGIATDSTEVTAELDGITSTATISVGEASLRSIAISASSNDIFEGSTSQLTASATYSDSDGSPKDVTEQVTWQSGTPEVASVSDAAPANGLVSALSQGSSIITAQLGEFTVETSLNIVAAPNKPGALTLQATPNVILNNASDRAVITATVMPNDEANGVIADGTMVELTPSNADLALSSAQGGTVSGQFTTDVTSAAAGQFVIIGEVPNTIAIDEAALRVVSSFSDVIDVSGFALRVVDDETGEVKAGSTFSAAIINTSNRTFEINEVEFFNGSTLVASFSPGEDALEAGESVDVSISLNQDRSDNGFSIVFGLSDAPTSTQFSVEQVF
jgi:hypothetical protein